MFGIGEVNKTSAFGHFSLNTKLYQRHFVEVASMHDETMVEGAGPGTVFLSLDKEETQAVKSQENQASQEDA